MSNSYLLYQKYEKRGNQPFHPSYPVEYSVDGNGTMQKVIKMENDPNCDSVSPTRYQWVVVTGDYMCSGTTKCQKEKEQRSDDFGMTWRDTGNYRAGSVIEYNSVDCGYIPPQYRTVSGTPYCNGYTKMFDTFNQVSYDGGTTWENTGVSGSTVIEYNSPDCGYPIYQWVDTDSYVCEGESIYGGQYFTTEALESGTITIDVPNIGYTTTYKNDYVRSISFSTDNGSTWTTRRTAVYGQTQYGIKETINVNAGDKIIWKGDAARMTFQDSFYGYVITATSFSATCSYKVYGNVMSLLYGDNFEDEKVLYYKYAFYHLFYNDTHVTDAKNLVLPATELEYFSYQGMFEGCTSLVEPPEILPFSGDSSRYSHGWYCDMFKGCSSLIKTPYIALTKTGTNSCSSMFEGCSSLTTVQSVLPATVEGGHDYAYMFKDCTSLTTAPALPATTLAPYCYEAMFEGCTSLTTAPELPSTYLPEYSYHAMFAGCTSLIASPSMSATSFEAYSCKSMFEGCSSLTTIPTLYSRAAAGAFSNMFAYCTSLTIEPIIPDNDNGGSNYEFSGMFKGCTGITRAQLLLKIPSHKSCYEEMFSGCTNLRYVKCLSLQPIKYNSEYHYTVHWLSGVAENGTFEKDPKNTSWYNSSYNGVPNTWTIIDTQ